MKLSLSKIIFFLTLLCSVAFAGGIEDDSGPEEVSAESIDGTKWNEENFPKLLEVYQTISETKNINCYVTWGKDKYVNDPNLTSNENYATWC